MAPDTANHHHILAQLDNDLKWAVARAYRARRRAGDSDAPARYAAIDVLRPHFPGKDTLALSVIAGAIIVHAARDHGKWFWDGVGHGWPPPWMPNATWGQGKT